MAAMWLIYNLLFPIGFLLLSPFYFWKMARRGGWRAGFGQRFGVYDAVFRAKVGSGVDVWIQAVSVGEVGLALALIQKWREQNPHLRILLTTTTSTGQAAAIKGVPRDVAVAYFPLDWWPITRRALALFRSKLLVIVETEIWPNAIGLAKRQGARVALVNGRISDKSFRHYSRFGFAFRQIFRRLDLVLTQSEFEAERFAALGAARESIRTVGQLKFDLGTGADRSREAWEALERCGVCKSQRIWVCGSTFAGEEEICLRVAGELRKEFSDLFLVLVPRHAERRTEVVELAKRMGAKMALRSELDSRKRDGTPYDTLLVDTTGELRGFYETASVVFVGKSLMSHGGQNPIEPAAVGKAVVVGPHMENFRDVMAAFRSAGAVVEVNHDKELATSVNRLLTDEEARKDLGQRAREVVRVNQGSLARTMEALDQFLPTP
jgi:3-deoxy-D-manno-octulosonic-acid transferase